MATAASRRSPRTWIGASVSVFERRQMRPQVEALEDEADLRALARDVSSRLLDQFAIWSLPIPEKLAIELDASTIDPLQVVETAQKSRLARAGWTDHADDFAALHLKRHRAAPRWRRSACGRPGRGGSFVSLGRSPRTQRWYRSMAAMSVVTPWLLT